MGSANQDPAKFRQYRERLKARGMRRIQLWVPDTAHPRFQEELRRQLALIERSDDDQETLDFIERSAEWDE